MTKQVALRIPDDLVESIDLLVEQGKFESRTAVLVAALRQTLRELREAEIAEEYRRAYAEQPVTEDERAFLDAAAQASLRALEEEERAAAKATS